MAVNEHVLSTFGLTPSGPTALFFSKHFKNRFISIITNSNLPIFHPDVHLPDYASFLQAQNKYLGNRNVHNIIIY